MARPTSKSPRQIAEEAIAAAERAKVRAAKAEAAQNPRMAEIVNTIEGIDKALNGYSRKLKGPNSFENRLKSAELRTAWIRAEQALVTAQDALDRATKDYYQHSIAGLAVRISAGETITDADMIEIGNNVPQDPGILALATACNDAETAWRSFVAQNKGEANAASEGA